MWTQGLGASTESLRMTPSWEGVLVCWRVEISRGFWLGWGLRIDGLRRMVWGLVSWSTRFFTWVATTSYSTTDWGKCCWKTAQQKGTWVCWLTAAEPEPAVCPGSQKGRWHPGLYQKYWLNTGWFSTCWHFVFVVTVTVAITLLWIKVFARSLKWFRCWRAALLLILFLWILLGRNYCFVLLDVSQIRLGFLQNISHWSCGHEWFLCAICNITTLVCISLFLFLLRKLPWRCLDGDDDQLTFNLLFTLPFLLYGITMKCNQTQF